MADARAADHRSYALRCLENLIATLILIILIAIGAVIVALLVVFFAQGFFAVGALSWIAGRSLFRAFRRNPHDPGPARMARIQEENRRLMNGESLWVIRKNMRAERQAAIQAAEHTIPDAPAEELRDAWDGVDDQNADRITRRALKKARARRGIS